MTYTVKHTTAYSGGNAQDHGYRSTVVLTADRLREYHFHSDHDGSNVRHVETRQAGPVSLKFRKLVVYQAQAKAPSLEATIKAHLAAASADTKPTAAERFQHHMARIDSAIATLREVQLANAPAPADLTWGHVASAEAIANKLDDILAFTTRSQPALERTFWTYNAKGERVQVSIPENL